MQKLLRSLFSAFLLLTLCISTNLNSFAQNSIHEDSEDNMEYSEQTNNSSIETNWLNSPENLQTEELTLSISKPNENINLAKYLKDEKMMEYYLPYPLKFQKEEQALTYAMDCDKNGNCLAPSQLVYTIKLKETQKPIGQITLQREIVPISETEYVYFANISYFIINNFQGKSYTFKAIKILLDELFKNNQENLVGIVTSIYEKNIASIKTIEKLGFENFAEETWKISAKELDNENKGLTEINIAILNSDRNSKYVFPTDLVNFESCKNRDNEKVIYFRKINPYFLELIKSNTPEAA